jgi:hypothetical protein
MCTACRTDEFFSHRAEGGRTGRFAVVAYLQPRTAAEVENVDRAAPDEAADDELALFDSLQPPGMPGFGPIGEGDA